MNRRDEHEDHLHEEDTLIGGPAPRSSGDLLAMMAEGFNASNETLQSAVPEAGAPEHSATAAPHEPPKKAPRKAIVSINGEDVEEIHVEHPEDERAA